MKMNKTKDTSQRDFIVVYFVEAGINVCFHAI
jgi:hypothetical protein